jgi:hypothetical protein
VEWNQDLIDRLDLAFNESQVCGLQFDQARAEARLFVEVLALPEVGPIDPDPRRVVVFSDVSVVEVVLRRDDVSDLGPVLPLASLDAVESFFASLGQADAMYGWSFVDVEDPGENWNVSPSLVLQGSTGDTPVHTMRWFTECGRPVSGDVWERYFLQGVIRFNDLRVERADGRPVSIEEFTADGRRWWDAFERHDARLSSEAQKQASASAAAWRRWGGTFVMVPGKPT